MSDHEGIAPAAAPRGGATSAQNDWLLKHLGLDVNGHIAAEKAAKPVEPQHPAAHADTARHAEGAQHRRHHRHRHHHRHHHSEHHEGHHTSGHEAHHAPGAAHHAAGQSPGHEGAAHAAEVRDAAAHLATAHHAAAHHARQAGQVAAAGHHGGAGTHPATHAAAQEAAKDVAAGAGAAGAAAGAAVAPGPHPGAAGQKDAQGHHSNMPSGMGGAVVAAKAGASAAIAAAHNGTAGHDKSLQTVVAEKVQSKAAKVGAQVAILQGVKKKPLEAILLKDKTGKTIKPGEDWKAAQEKVAQEKLAQEKAQWAPSAPAAATGGQGAFSKLEETSKEVGKPITAAKQRLGALAEEMTKSSLAGDHQAAQETAAKYREVEQELAKLKVARFSATKSAIFGKGVFQSGAGAAVARSAGPLGGVISGVTAAASDYAAVKSGKLKKEDAAADTIVKTGTGALSTMAGAAAGAEAGAAVGVWFGGVGAIPGAVVGAGVGIAAAAVSSKAMDETIVKPLTKGIGDGIRDAEKGNTGQFVKDVGHGVVGAAGNVAGRAVDLVGDVVGGTVKGVGDHLKGFAHGAEDLTKGNVKAAIADVAKGEFDGTADIAKGLWSGAKDFLRHEE